MGPNMPPKRRASKRKAPAKEEETKVEPTVEPVVEETPAVEESAVEVVEEVEDAEPEEEEAEPKKELTDEEKIAELDKLSKAHPFGLLANLAKLSNKHRAVFAIAKNEKPEGADDSFEPSMSLTARFGEIKITVPKVAGDNFKFAKKVGADLLLKEMYGETHELDAETEGVKEANPDMETAQDPEWYKEKKAEYATSCSERVDRIIKRIGKNDKYDDEQKADKIKKFESWRNCNEDLLEYDEIYKIFDHPYYRVMHNALTFPRSKGLKYSTKLFKFEGETEVEIPSAGKGEKRTDEEKEAATVEETTKYKVCITVFKDDAPLIELEHTDETSKLREAKSEAAYKILEKLLMDKVLDRVTRRDLKNKNDRNNQQNRFNNKGRPAKNANQNANQNQAQQNIMQPMQMPMQMPMMNGQNGQMMMMPVMMGPNGPMMMMPPNMMGGQQMGATTGPPPAKKKKNNNKNKNKKQAHE